MGQSFSEISASLDKALSVVQQKKDTLSKLDAEWDNADREYKDAVEAAQTLKGLLTSTLNGILPDTSNSRVRISAA